MSDRVIDLTLSSDDEAQPQATSSYLQKRNTRASGFGESPPKQESLHVPKGGGSLSANTKSIHHSDSSDDDIFSPRVFPKPSPTPPPVSASKLKMSSVKGENHNSSAKETVPRKSCPKSDGRLFPAYSMPREATKSSTSTNAKRKSILYDSSSDDDCLPSKRLFSKLEQRMPSADFPDPEEAKQQSAHDLLGADWLVEGSTQTEKSKQVIDRTTAESSGQAKIHSMESSVEEVLSAIEEAKQVPTSTKKAANQSKGAPHPHYDTDTDSDTDRSYSLESEEEPVIALQVGDVVSYNHPVFATLCRSTITAICPLKEYPLTLNHFILLDKSTIVWKEAESRGMALGRYELVAGGTGSIAQSITNTAARLRKGRDNAFEKAFGNP